MGGAGSGLRNLGSELFPERELQEDAFILARVMKNRAI
jgi:hypothetical protein